VVINLEGSKSVVGDFAADVPVMMDKSFVGLGEIATPAKQAIGDPGRAARSPCDLHCAGFVNPDVQDGSRAGEHAEEVLRPVIIEPIGDPEARAERGCQESGSGCGADQGIPWKVELNAAGIRPCVDNDIEPIFFHGRVQVFFDDRVQAMNLVDKQHIAVLKVGQDPSKVSRSVKNRSRARPDAGPHFVGDDVSESRFPESGGTCEEDVIERFASVSCSGDEDFEVLDDLYLTDELGEARRS
jgi:hypothetical protein